jgi:hypothetical protein
MNPVWMDDLRVLETARHQQVQKELDTAIQARDLTRANSLVAELDDPSWVYRPQPQLVAQAKERRQRLAAALATEEMQAIEQQLSAAYSALDVDAARTARAKLRDRQQVAGLPVEHPLIQRAAPALAWLAEQDEHDSRAHGFSAALSRLEEALEADSDRPTLERLFHATQRYDQEIPLRLVRRYEERIRACELSGRRRFSLLTTAVVLALLLVAAGVGWVIYRGQRETAVAQAAQGLARLVADKNVAEAQRYYADLQRRAPAIALRPEVQQEVGRLNGMVAAEMNRRETFETFLSRAVDAGLETPDRSALLEANKLATTADEKSRAADWKAKVDARDRQRQRERDERFEAKFRKLVAEVEGSEHWIERGAKVEAENINRLLARIDSLQDQSRGVTQQLSSQVKPFRLRVVALSRQLTEWMIRGILSSTTGS